VDAKLSVNSYLGQKEPMQLLHRRRNWLLAAWKKGTNKMWQ